MAQGIMRRELQITDINEIKEILDKGTVLHLGLVDGDEPYVVPMNYGYTLVDGKLTIYLHGATAGRKLDIMRVNPKIFFSSMTKQAKIKFFSQLSEAAKEKFPELINDYSRFMVNKINTQ